MIIFPSTKKTAFNCPHCSAYAAQTWFTLGANWEEKPPVVEVDKFWAKIEKDSQTGFLKGKDDLVNSLLEHVGKIKRGLVFIKRDQRNNRYAVENLFLSECYNCKKVAVWVYQNLVSPAQKAGPLPNQDLPEDIIHDFEEARSIVDLSPRGSTALLRLCIQKLCKELGEKGDNINNDIKNLMAKGLDPLIQKSLDTVRVIGNEAVHGGVMNLKDDKDTALNLFKLVNEIAEQMISRPKRLKQMYESLPEDKRRGIEARDKKVGN